MPNYNLKTQCTMTIVMPLYDVGNIPKLIINFFDTAQRYAHMYTYIHIVCGVRVMHTIN